jgi:hypothetical protein
MAFQATPAMTGVPTFNIIHINPAEVARAFQVYLTTGSKLTGVDLDDINLGLNSLPANSATVTLAELVSRGMKLFDAVVWLTAGRPASHSLVIDPAITRAGISSSHEIARSVFYCYFMLLVQARYPAGPNAVQKPKIPNFLTTIMGMDEDQAHYVSVICSFSPEKFDPKWVRYVNFNGFGQEALSRFGLGVAGYRSFGPFGLYRPKANFNPELADAFEFARTIAKGKSSWDVHPLLRSPNVLAKRGNLNKNLGNLILDCFSDSDIDEMVRTKVLFKKPEREASHIQYKTWTAHDDISGNDFIFSD